MAGPGKLRAARARARKPQDEDAPLVERARGGDRAAFEELVRRYADRLYAVVVRLTLDEQEAEEITQEAFLRAWRGIEGSRGSARFFTWLYRIGVNEAKRRAERRSSESWVSSLEERPAQDVPDACPGPEQRTTQRELRSALEQAIRALPLAYRAPLILRDVEGLSTAEAASILGLREAAFKSRVHRARLAVREAVDDYLWGGSSR